MRWFAVFPAVAGLAERRPGEMVAGARQAKASEPVAARETTGPIRDAAKPMQTHALSDGVLEVVPDAGTVQHHPAAAAVAHEALRQQAAQPGGKQVDVEVDAVGGLAPMGLQPVHPEPKARGARARAFDSSTAPLRSKDREAPESGLAREFEAVLLEVETGLQAELPKNASLEASLTEVAKGLEHGADALYEDLREGEADGSKALVFFLCFAGPVCGCTLFALLWHYWLGPCWRRAAGTPRDVAQRTSRASTRSFTTADDGLTQGAKVVSIAEIHTDSEHSIVIAPGHQGEVLYTDDGDVLVDFDDHTVSLWVPRADRDKLRLDT